MRLCPLRSYEECRSEIWNADMLVWRRPHHAGLIGVGGRSTATHISCVGWWDDALMNIETKEFHGGRVVTLSSQVYANPPGTISVYRCLDLNDSQREAVLRRAKRRAGQPYGWKALRHQFYWRLPVVHLFMQPNENDDDSTSGAEFFFCSGAYANDFRLGSGIDPVPNLADVETEPAELARSRVFTPMFSLAPGN